MNAQSLVVPITLPALVCEEAARWNRLGCQRAPLRLPGNEAYTLYKMDRLESELIGDQLWIDLAFGDDRLQATMPRLLLLELLRSLDRALLLDPLPPPDLMALLLETALLPLIEVLERHLVQKVSVHAVAAAGANGSGGKSQTVPIRLRGPGLDETLTVTSDAAAIDRVLRDWPKGDRPMLNLRVPVAVVAGETALTVGLIASLCVGDVVLMQDRVAKMDSDGTPCVLRLVVADRIEVIIRSVSGNWRLDAPPQHANGKGETVIGSAEAEPNDKVAQLDELDEIPVRMIFEAARIELPLSSVRQLGEGSVLDFEAIPGMVRILVNGRRIGDGELVTIDGRAGVRITGFIANVDGQDAS